MSIVLIGPRCSGKTTVGEILANKLNREFIDADKIFEFNYGPISDFLANRSWEEFRRIESCLIEKICAYYKKPIVLSPGGGAVAHSKGKEYGLSNVKNLKAFGRLFYLLPSANLEESSRILAERQARSQESQKQRPNLTDEKDLLKATLEILRERHPIYLSVANDTIYTNGLSQAQITDRIIQLIKL